MSGDELSQVKDFSIWNEFGRIDFIGETDLTQVDLKRDINITERSIQVYQE